MAGSKGVTIVFLGPLRDLAGEDAREATAPLDWEGLLDAVGPQVAEQLREKRVNVACSGKVLADKTDLLAQDGDEIALLPPVSGG
ncbi:MoaD/ThiS family protein [Altererythrobacter sp.]|uniref:MoaD/ThiS family protein n=1 Tax=Altererythrobacter sp. TaxID=1872480 RepID=UPI003D09134D